MIYIVYNMFTIKERGEFFGLDFDSAGYIGEHG